MPSDEERRGTIEVFTPPTHFALVEPGMYRSVMPAPPNFPFLRQLGLRSVIVLSADSIARGIVAFFRDNGIEIFHTGAQSGRKDTWKPTWKPLSEEVIKTSLQLTLRADLHPLLLCDTSGVQSVGVVVGCLRRLQNWNLNSVVNEYRAFAGRKTRYVHEQMIELFDTDLVVVPEDPPSWYSEQLAMELDDDDMYEVYLQKGCIASDGRLDTSKDPELDDHEQKYAYRVYYYSSESPLNSVHGAKPPRIQRL